MAKFKVLVFSSLAAAFSFESTCFDSNWLLPRRKYFLNQNTSVRAIRAFTILASSPFALFFSRKWLHSAAQRFFWWKTGL